MENTKNFIIFFIDITKLSPIQAYEEWMHLKLKDDGNEREEWKIKRGGRQG